MTLCSNLHVYRCFRDPTKHDIIPQSYVEDWLQTVIKM